MSFDGKGATSDPKITVEVALKEADQCRRYPDPVLNEQVIVVLANEVLRLTRNTEETSGELVECICTTPAATMACTKQCTATKASEKCVECGAGPVDPCGRAFMPGRCPAGKTPVRPDADALAAVPELKAKKALVLYFQTQQDVDEFVALIEEARPDMRAMQL